MIICCEKCNKNFEIDSKLIPKDGRLLKCGSCDYEWFFKESLIEGNILKNNQIDDNDFNLDPLVNQKSINDINVIPEDISKSKKKDELKISPILTDKEIQTNPNLEKLDIAPNINEYDQVSYQTENKEILKKKKFSFFNIILIFIISVVSIILILDTFKEPISIYVPNIEYILYNLYETLKDIKLFFNDLY